MPIRDWTRMDAGTFHAFHTSWLTHLMEALNAGLLPAGYYALSEQVATRMQTDVLTLRAPLPATGPQADASDAGEVAVATLAPAASLIARPDPSRKPRRPTRRARHLVIRHLSGHQVVALIEIVSPANKDRKQNVRELAEKVVRSLEAGVHVLLLDLLPPGRHDPNTMHGAVWAYFDTAAFVPIADSPLMLVSYLWDGTEPEAYIEPTAVGKTIPARPLFLTPQMYVNVPLEATYHAAFRGMPQFWREILERKTSP